MQRLSDLPTHTYAIAGKASDLVQDPDQVVALAVKVEANINDDLTKYEIDDPATVRNFYSDLVTIDFIKRDYPSALANIARVRALQDKPAAQIMTGVIDEALILGFQKPGEDVHQAIETNLRQLLGELPYPPIQDMLRSDKERFELLSANFVLGQIQGQLDPVAQSGQISDSIAIELISAAFSLEYIVPYKDDLLGPVSAELDSNSNEIKPDIWAARDFPLTPQMGLKPTVIAIWDSGVDISLYQSQLWSNPKVNHDGYSGDLHGIAWTLDSDVATALLAPLDGTPQQNQDARSSLTGMEDLQANVDSPAASALRAKLASLPPPEVTPFIENLSQFGDYSHGTHVAGIAVRGNPAARILVCRITFDYHLIPEKPTIALARKDAAASIRQIAYFMAHGVRVVNMSWGGDEAGVESALEANKAGGTPEQRRALAKQIFGIGYRALYNAMKSAPGILFVAAAGNGNNDVEFSEVLPSGFKLPNLIVVGAVDQAGDQTSFTSFGNVDVYADGYEVPSYIPGGQVIKLSGTSMAAPEVTNLAAKMFALNPSLTPALAKGMIVDYSDSQTVNAKKLLLINPAKTLKPLVKPILSLLGDSYQSPAPKPRP